MNNRTGLARTLCVAFAVIFAAVQLEAGRPYSGKQLPATVDKVQTDDVYKAMLINSVFNYYANNGDGSFNPFSADAEGFEYTKGTSGMVIFEDGIVWGGFQKGVKKVGGSTYNHGLQAGKIVTAGTPTSAPVADDPGLPTNRMFRVRPDIRPTTDAAKKAELIAILETQEVPYISRYEAWSADQLYSIYVADWNEWPAADGAPYTDVNNNGRYDPDVDIPGVPGADQTLYYVANDMNATRTNHLYGSNPIGIEQHRTIWAYNRQGALGSTIFASTKLINKSGSSIDSMYISQWADPDLGGALGYADDFVGCDTNRSLGYVYNGQPSDGFFGTAVPAGGFVFFQGPIVATGNPNDSAIFNLQYRHGYKNLKMSAFNFFVNGSSTYADPRLQDPRGTDEWYNLMNGLIGRTASPYINPITGLPDKFLLSGDPVAGTGWIDGILAPPGDRRMALITGPFTMNDGDTQEVVVANLAALATDRFTSLSKLLKFTDVAQQAYNALFALPAPPENPKVTATGSDGEVLLTWDDSAQVARTEGQNFLGYKFEGYNVFQVDPKDHNKRTRLATYDLKTDPAVISDSLIDPVSGTKYFAPIQYGSNSGIKRYYRATTDKYGTFGTSFVNGQTYYFEVSAYNYASDNYLNDPSSTNSPSIESNPNVISVIPQDPNPGNILHSTRGQAISDVTDISDSNGSFDGGSVVARVIDPTQVTGHTYRVFFDDTSTAIPTWGLIDQTDNNRVRLAGQTHYADDGTDRIIDGIQVSVTNPTAAYKAAVLIKNGNTDLSANPPNILRALSPDTTWAFDIINASSHASALSRMGGSREGYHDYEIRFTATGSQYYAKNFQVAAGDSIAPNRLPMEFFDITVNKKIIPAVRDASGDGIYDQNPSGDINAPFTSGAYWEGIYVQDPISTAYYTEPLPNPATFSSAGFAARRLLFINHADTSAGAPFPVPQGTVIRLLTKKRFNRHNAFTVNTNNYRSETGNTDQAKNEVNRINVFPNPYFGFNKAEINKYNKFVTFSHLPTQATIRIFTLSGVLVREIRKDDKTQFVQWDLSNSAGIPSAAGIYIVHIDMPALGATKVLKLAIIPETQYLDRL